jgi:DNA helicase HerA-like ATPase
MSSNPLIETHLDHRFLGHIAWDGPSAVSDRVILHAPYENGRRVLRNQYVRILDDDGHRSGFLARIVAGPFFREGPAPASPPGAKSHAVAELELQGELVKGRPRDTNARPAPGAQAFVLAPAEVAELHGFEGEMLLGNLTGQDDLWVELRSKDKGVLPRNVGIFGTVGSGKSNSCQVVIEEAARNGWAVIVLDVEGEYIEMDEPADDGALMDRLAWFGLRPQGLSDFHVYHPASCSSDRESSQAFTLRLADFDTNVIGEILQVTLPERNALVDCVEYLQQKARTKVSTVDADALGLLLDASAQAKLPFNLRSLRERAIDRSPRSTEFFDYAGITAKLNWLVHSEAFDVVNMTSLDPTHMMVPGRVSVIDVSIANDIVKNLVTADLLRKAFALKVLRPNSPPTLIVIEEAHSFISRERAQSMHATLHMLRNITRRGRKRWLAMAFVSQQPGHLPPEIFELCNTRIVHTLRSTHNLDALIATTGDVGHDLWARCPLLGPGQAVVSSPQLGRSVIVSMRPAACRRRFVR